MRVLVIEDNAELREALSETFREEGYDVDEAESGELGLYRALNWDYDLVLLDVMLPETDGWAILQKIRATKTVPVIMITARVALADRLRGLRNGADDYIPKPFELDEVIARAAAVLRRSQAKGVPTGVMEIGDVKLDAPGRAVFFRGEPVEVTPLEYNIVKVLMENAGSVISRSYLYDRVFDEEGDESLSNMIDVYICRLRRKLGKDFIHTRRGHGYVVFAAEAP